MQNTQEILMGGGVFSAIKQCNQWLLIVIPYLKELHWIKNFVNRKEDIYFYDFPDFPLPEDVNLDK